MQKMWEQGLPAMRRAGGARSQERCNNYDKHLAALTQSPAQKKAPVSRGNIAQASAYACPVRSKRRASNK